LRASAKKIAEANSKIIEKLWQLFAEAKIVEFRRLEPELENSGRENYETLSYFYELLEMEKLSRMI
jgi:hypothetical protein